MTEKRYKVHNMVKGMNVGESVDLELMKELTEKYGAYENVDVEIMDNGKPMTYKEVVKLLNENEQLKQQINDDIRLDWNQDYREFNKDTLYIEDHNTKIKLKDGRLHIEVFIPKLDEYFRFNYIVTGRKLEREYNTIKGDCDE